MQSLILAKNVVHVLNTFRIDVLSDVRDRIVSTFLNQPGKYENLIIVIYYCDVILGKIVEQLVAYKLSWNLKVALSFKLL